MNRRELLLVAGGAAATAVSMGAGGMADAGQAREIELVVRETAGLRRFGYPVVAEISLRRGELADPTQTGLIGPAGQAVAAQFDVAERWPDGSVRRLSACFNLSLGPLDTVRLTLRCGEGTAPRPPSGGQRAVEEAGAWRLLAYTIPKTGPVMISSIRYGQREFLRPEGMRFAALAAGEGAALFPAESRAAELLRAGPVNLALRLRGVYRLPDEEVPWVTTVECPNSKSWVKVIHTVDDPRWRLAHLSLSAPYVIQSLPALFDYGCGSWVYGHLRQGQKAVIFQPAADGRTKWQIVTGSDLVSEYARATPSQPRFEGWAHLIDGAAGGRAIGLGSPELGAGTAGSLWMAADGTIRLAWQMTDARRHRVTAYFHHVGDPIHVSALTSPASMLQPLEVRG